MKGVMSFLCTFCFFNVFLLCKLGGKYAAFTWDGKGVVGYVAMVYIYPLFSVTFYAVYG